MSALTSDHEQCSLQLQWLLTLGIGLKSMVFEFLLEVARFETSCILILEMVIHILYQIWNIHHISI